MKDRLAKTPSWERRIFAAGVAERLVRQYEVLPHEHREQFTPSVRPLLDSVWEGVLGHQAAFVDITRGVGEFMLNDSYADRPDGPEQPGETAASAVLYAAATCLYGCLDFVTWTSDCGVEGTHQHLEYLAVQGEAGPAADPCQALAAELQRQLHDLDLITAHSGAERRAHAEGVPDTPAGLRRELRTRLSRV